MWGLVKNIRGQGKTIFLTTHYMEETEELCDHVGVIDHGKIIALDTPKNLVSNLGAESKVLFKVMDRDVAATEFEGLPAVSRVEKAKDGFVLYTSGSFGMKTAISVIGLVDGELVGECKHQIHLEHVAAADFVGGEQSVCRPIQKAWGPSSSH